jgi:hypothetical protein
MAQISWRADDGLVARVRLHAVDTTLSAAAAAEGLASARGERRPIDTGPTDADRRPIVARKRLSTSTLPLMASHGWTFRSVTGGCRARKEAATTVVYDHGGSHRMAWIVRDAAAGTLDVVLMADDVTAHPEVATQLIARGHADLAERLRLAIDPESDAHAVSDAFAVVLADRAD